jgi:hypothetical protein
MNMFKFIYELILEIKDLQDQWHTKTGAFLNHK